MACFCSTTFGALALSWNHPKAPPLTSLVPGLGQLEDQDCWLECLRMAPAYGLDLLTAEPQGSETPYMAAQGSKYEGCITFSGPTLEVTERHFCHTVLFKGVTVHSGAREGDIYSTS